MVVQSLSYQELYLDLGVLMNNVRPQLTLLNEEQIQQIHHYALHILSETGVRVDSSSVVEMLKKTKQRGVSAVYIMETSICPRSYR